jgi:hypothetical protein
MAVQTRTPSFKAAKGGSAKLAIGLESADIAATAYDIDSSDSLATAGWHILSQGLSGGEIGPDRDSEKVKNEADVEIGEVITRDEFLISQSTVIVTPRFLSLLEWLEDNFVKARYPLPTGPENNYVTKELDSNGDTSGKVAHWFIFPRVSANVADWSIPVNNDDFRQVEFELTASRPEGDSAFDFVYEQALLPLDTTQDSPDLDKTWTSAPYDGFTDEAISGA